MCLHRSKCRQVSLHLESNPPEHLRDCIADILFRESSVLWVLSTARSSLYCTLCINNMFQWVFTLYTSSPGASIRVFQRPILVYLDVRGVEISLLSTVSISNCRYQEAPLRSARPGVRGLFTWVKSPMNFKKILAFCSSWEILSE